MLFRSRAGRIHGHDGNLLAQIAVLAREPRDQSRLSGAGRTGDAQSHRVSGARVGALQNDRRLRRLVLDERDGAREARALALERSLDQRIEARSACWMVRRNGPSDAVSPLQFSQYYRGSTRSKSIGWPGHDMEHAAARIGMDEDQTRGAQTVLRQGHRAQLIRNHEVVGTQGAQRVTDRAR